MKRTMVCKAFLSVLLLSLWMAGFKYGYGSDATMVEHLLWPLSHVNIWHLAGNLWVLWYIPGQLRILESYAIAVLCSFLPVWSLWGIGYTAGFSGVLCASVGIKWGVWCASCKGKQPYWTFCKRVLPFIAISVVIPHVNWCIHLYCLLAGLAYGAERR